MKSNHKFVTTDYTVTIPNDLAAELADHVNSGSPIVPLYVEGIDAPHGYYVPEDVLALHLFAIEVISAKGQVEPVVGANVELGQDEYEIPLDAHLMSRR